jgi:hypothetical protein
MAPQGQEGYSDPRVGAEAAQQFAPLDTASFSVTETNVFRINEFRPFSQSTLTKPWPDLQFLCLILLQSVSGHASNPSRATKTG